MIYYNYVSDVCVFVCLFVFFFFCLFFFWGGGVEGKIRTVAGASWLRVGRQVGKVCAMYTKQLMGV